MMRSLCPLRGVQGGKHLKLAPFFRKHLGLQKWAPKPSHKTSLASYRGQKASPWRTPKRRGFQGPVGPGIRKAQKNSKKELKMRQNPTSNLKDSLFRLFFGPSAERPRKPLFISKRGSTPTHWARGLRDPIQKWALQTQKTLYF